MSYATQTDLEARFGSAELIELTDRAALGVIDAAVLNRALADADALIDSHLGAAYPVPLSPVPPLVVKLACDVARYFLYEDRVTEIVRTRYEDAIASLKALAASPSPLVGGAAPVAGGVAVAAGERVFSRELLADY